MRLTHLQVASSVLGLFLAAGMPFGALGQTSKLPNAEAVVRLQITGISPKEAAPGTQVFVEVDRDIKKLELIRWSSPDGVATSQGTQIAQRVIQTTVPESLRTGACYQVAVWADDEITRPYSFCVPATWFGAVADAFRKMGALGGVLSGIFIGFVGLAVGFYFSSRGRAQEKEARDRAKMLEAQPRRRAPDSGDRDSDRSVPAGEIIEPPGELVKALADGECVLCAGASLHAELGAPTNLEIVSKLLEAARERASAADLNTWKEALDYGEIDSVKDLLRANLKDARISGPEDAFIREVVSDAIANFSADGEVANLLGRLPFVGAMTTNWDSALNQVFSARSPKEPAAALTSPAEGRDFFLLRAFGDPSSSSFAFTAREYRQHLDDNPAISRFLTSVFTRNSILFLGSRVEDIEQFIVLSGIRASTERMHFALVPRDSLFEVQRSRMLALYRISLIACDPDDSEAVVRFLRGLRNGLPATRVIPRAQRTEPKIDEITLVNIGAFTNTTIQFEKRWTVLLGNNGSGKSTILRAIALVLCGDDDRAKARAASLLRGDADTGSIEIKAGQEKYRTELIRDKTRVIVRTRQDSPLQTDNWAVFGFPAVRGISTSEAAAPLTRYPTPLVDDVLPLLGNGLDSRLDDLKQWIIDVHNKSEDSNLPLREREKALQFRKALFDVVNALTPGFNIGFSRYDHDSKTIYVNTADGEIPLDSLSQGISSTIGWAGALLARLYDIYDGVPNPAHERGLLLVDEIDSHLHPAWQQLIAGKIKRLFPNLCVIATSHSPLIVGTLDANEAIRISRRRIPSADGSDKEQSVMVAQPLRRSYRGWRVDQVLTDDGFEMQTSRDPSLEDVAQPLRQEYASLMRKARRTSDEDTRLVEVGRRLESGLVSPGETPLERAADEKAAQLLRKREELFAKLLDTEFDPDAVLKELEALDDESRNPGEANT